MFNTKFLFTALWIVLLSIGCRRGDTYEVDEETTSQALTIPELRWSKERCKVTFGDDDAMLPTLINTNGVEVVFSSSDCNVATISDDGIVALVAVGQTTITATSIKTNKYNIAQAHYTLIVSKSAAGIAWSTSTCNATIDAENNFPTLNNPHNLAITYSSSNNSVATISTEGVVEIISAGTTTITATSAATSDYEVDEDYYTLIVSKAAAGIEWSISTCDATIDAKNNFPTLNNPHNLAITYSSSDNSVATISTEGVVEIISAGTTTITAMSVATDKYQEGKADYTLNVHSDSDTGAGVYNYSSTGDSESEDDISNTTFTRKISIIYHTDSCAEVLGDFYGYASVSGNDVTIKNTGSEYIVYELTGTTTDGFFKLYSDRKQAIILKDVNITNKGGAAINIQSKKRTFVMVNATNALADGASYTDTPASEDEKATLFSEGQLVFSGSGSLTVNASGKSGIISDDYIRVMNSPTISTTSTAGHALRGKESIRIDAGTITAKTSADMKKGFSSDSLVVFNGGVTNISVTGATAYDSEDGDYTSSAGVKADKLFYMNGGSLTITNSGSGGKGINVGARDTSNDCKAYFTGGTVDITCTGAYNTTAESGAKGIKVGKKFSSTSYTGDMYVSGGSIIVRSTGSNSSRDSGNEAVESKGVIEVSGGELFAISTSDDAINSADDFTIEDGYVCGISTGNDGLDSNGNFYINGGVVMAASAGSPEVGIDANSEGGKKLYINGGILFVTGGLESGASLTQACYKASSFSKSTWYGLTIGNKTYAFKTHVSASGSTLVVSGSQTPTLTSGVTISGGTTYFDGYAIRDGSYSGGTSVTLSTYSGSSNRPGGRP